MEVLDQSIITLNLLIVSSCTTNLEVSAGLLLALGALVGAVAAVVLGVALPGVGHAAAVVALELRAAARHVDAAGLVREVAAVVLRVTHERRRDATTRLTHELGCAACCF